jgi:hypothetical protein
MEQQTISVSKAGIVTSLQVMRAAYGLRRVVPDQLATFSRTQFLEVLEVALNFIMFSLICFRPVAL